MEQEYHAKYLVTSRRLGHPTDLDQELNTVGN